MADKHDPAGSDAAPTHMSPEELARHEATFNGFIKVSAVVAIISVLILIFLAFVGT